MLPVLLSLQQLPAGHRVCLTQVDTVCAWGAGRGLDPLCQQGDLQQQQLDCCSPVTFTAVGWLAGLQVVFRLHESFQSPIRELTVPPYELTEVGWGEFDIAVTVGAWGLHKLGCRSGCVWSPTSGMAPCRCNSLMTAWSRHWSWCIS